MVKKKSSAGPRLKLCSACEEPNPPRTFYCKKCNNPFYSEEYMSNRPSLAIPTQQVNGEAKPESKQKESAPAEGGTLMTWLATSLAATSGPAEVVVVGSSVEVEVESTDGRLVSVELPGRSSHAVDEMNVLLNCGHTSVNAVDLQQGRLIVLAENRVVQVWETTQSGGGWMFRSEHELAQTSVVKSVRWVRYSGAALFIITRLDAVEVYAAHSCALLWSSKHHFVDQPFYPTSVDARIASTGDLIEILITNNHNNFIHYLTLALHGPSLGVREVRVYGYNDPARRAPDDPTSSVAESGWSSCVCFLDSVLFAVGFSNGSVGVFDLRYTHGPLKVVSTLAGIRRWLVDIVPGEEDGTIAAAFQAAAVVKVNSGDILPVGGDVRAAQCYGVGMIGDRIFSAMSSGVVLSLNGNVRDKLRRAMTGYVAQWSALAAPTPDTPTSVVAGSEDTLESKILGLLQKRSQVDLKSQFRMKLFGRKNFPKNLKSLRATDGASNEPTFAQEGWEGVPIRCLRADKQSGLVAYGLDGGVVHVFQHREGDI